jgi:hypothetical protein
MALVAMIKCGLQPTKLFFTHLFESIVTHTFGSGDTLPEVSIPKDVSY